MVYAANGGRRIAALLTLRESTSFLQTAAEAVQARMKL
jgi:hypothetical protein